MPGSINTLYLKWALGNWEEDSEPKSVAQRHAMVFPNQFSQAYKLKSGDGLCNAILEIFRK